MTKLPSKNILMILIIISLILIIFLPNSSQNMIINQSDHLKLNDREENFPTINSKSVSLFSNRLTINAISPNINTVDCGGIQISPIDNLVYTNKSLYVTNCPNIIISDNFFTSINNPDNDSFAIKIYNSPGALIRGNEISGIHSNNAAVGILVINSDDIIIEKNNLYNITGTPSVLIKYPLTDGILIDNSSNVIISHNIISLLNGGHVSGIYANGTGIITINNNEISGLTGTNAVTAGIIAETYDFANFTENTASNIHTENYLSSPIDNFMTLGITTITQYSASYVKKTLFQRNLVENISVHNYNTNGKVDLFGISSIADEDIIIQNTIRNLTLTGTLGANGLQVPIVSFSQIYDIANSTISNNLLSDMYIGENLENGTFFGIYVHNKYELNLEYNQIINLNNSARVFTANPGSTSLYYFETAVHLNFIHNSVDQILSTYPVSEVHLKVSDNFSADQNIYKFEFDTNNRLDIYYEEPQFSGYDSYEISRNGTSVEIGVYDASQLLNINSVELEVGYYNYKMSYFDNIGNNPLIFYESTIHVIPSIPIVINDLMDTSIEHGSTLILEWNIISSELFNYLILINGIDFANAIDFAGPQVSIELPSTLGVGIHNITIVINNQDLTLTDSLFVSIIDSVLPSISKLEDLLFDESVTNTTLSWTLNDLNPGNYTIFVNNQSTQIGAWINSENVTIELFNLTIGNYTVYIFVVDNYGNEISDNLLIIIGDFKDPSISTPADVFLNEGDIGKKITWVVYDEHPANFTIGINGITEISEQWDGEAWITFDLEGFEWGFYNISLTITDLTGNEVTDWVFVRVYNSFSSSTEADVEQAPGIFGIVNNTVLVGAGIVVGVVGVGYGITRRRG